MTVHRIHAVPAALLTLVLVIEQAHSQPAKPLSEADVLKLVELQIDDEAIIHRLKRGGAGFKVDEAVLKRLKEAGASEAVLQALLGKPLSSGDQAGKMMLWAKRNYGSTENPLHSEVSINGKLVDVLTSDTYKPVDKYLQPGWNTITIKTTPQPINSENQLFIRVGPMIKDPRSDEMKMTTVLWLFDNGSDWKHDNGKWSHRLGPDTKSVTLNYKLYWAGLEREGHKVKKGDYVIHGRSNYGVWLTPLTATVYVNGTPLNSFVTGDRQVVVNSLLKQGKNEIKLVTHRVADVISDNDIHVDLAGPAEYSVTQERYLLKPIVQQKALAGWERNQKTGQLDNKVKAGEDTMERVITFMLDEAPK